MSIGFVIVTYNSAQVLFSCLDSIPRGYEIVIVDNASNDNSIFVANAFDVSVIKNSENLGFSVACNQGARLISASHVFFLNPDTILSKNTMPELETAIRLLPDAAGFGPAIRIAGQTATFRSASYVQDQGRRYIENVDAPAGYAEVDFLDGAALICNRELFLTLGGFDESLFLYYDDDDLSFRIRSQNKKLIYVPQTEVFHLKKKSSGDGLRLDYIRSFHETRSRMLVASKYGIPFNPASERKRAIIRLARALATFSVRKAVRYSGIISALSSVQSNGFRNPASIKPDQL